MAVVPKAALAKIIGLLQRCGDIREWLGIPQSHWNLRHQLFGSRAVTFYGLGPNRPQDAIYPTSEVDAAGKPYSGANKYVMHFDRDQMPPAKGFWSLTMYDPNYFFVAIRSTGTLSAREINSRRMPMVKSTC